MTFAEGFNLLLESTVATSAALLLVLVLRRPLRATFGAGIAYGAWMLVPVAWLAVLLPAAPAAIAVPMLPVVLFGAAPVVVAASTPAAIDPRAWLALAWVLGAVLLARTLIVQQRAFRARLGRVRRRDDGLQQAEASVGLPAAIGWWRPAGGDRR